MILVDESAERARMVEGALKAQGFNVVAVLGSGDDLSNKLAALAADVVIIDMDSPDRDILESMRQVGAERPHPIVMFSQDGNPDMIKATIEVGVSAYVVDGLRPERIRPVVDVAIARFAQFQSLRSELDKAKSTLAERKQIERAKGILMKRRDCDEDTAYGLMRKMAMDQKIRLADVASRIIDAAELLG